MYISFLPAIFQSNRSSRPVKVSISSNDITPAAAGVGVSQQGLGSLRTRRWPVRYTQPCDLDASTFSRPVIASPARIGGPALIRRTSQKSPVAANFSGLPSGR
jgi:hypothetical protein